MQSYREAQDNPRCHEHCEEEEEEEEGSHPHVHCGSNP